MTRPVAAARKPAPPHPAPAPRPHRSAASAGSSPAGSLLTHLGAPATAILLTLAFPPLSWSPLGWIALAPWAVALPAMSRRGAGWNGLAAGFLFFLGNLTWLRHLGGGFVVGWIAPIALAMAASGYWVAFAVLYRGGSRRLPALRFVLLPALWCALEALRGRAPLGGLPWFFLAHTQGYVPLWVQVADLGGATATSLVLATVSSLAAEAWLGVRGRRLAVEAGATLLLVALAAIHGAASMRRHGPDRLDEGPVVVAIQPNIPAYDKHGGMSRQALFEVHATLTREAVEDSANLALVCWPETMHPPVGEGMEGDRWGPGYGFDEARFVEEEWTRGRVLEPLLAPRGIHLLVGAEFLRPRPEAPRPTRNLGDVWLTNAAVLYGPGGERLGHYDKRALVPMAEALPGADWMPQGLRDAIVRGFEQVFLGGHVTAFFRMRPGEEPELLTLPWHGRDVRLGVPICFDNSFAWVARDFAAAGADLLINLSNENWYLDSAEMDHMTIQGVFRAVETRRTVLRVTNTGVTSLLLPDGTIPRRLEVGGRDRDVRGTLAAAMPLDRGESFYVRYGEVLAGLLGLIAGILLLWPGPAGPGGGEALSGGEGACVP